ncbi:MAG: hypothetical protein ABJC74_16260 [Gemmatimonadota bacterium]
MAGEISEYQVVEFVNLKAATAAAAALLEYISSPRGMRHLTGPRRAVIWGEGPEALLPLQSRLYLSPGAMEAIRELKLSFNTGDTIAASALPATVLLLHGEGVARPGTP